MHYQFSPVFTRLIRLPFRDILHQGPEQDPEAGGGWRPSVWAAFYGAKWRGMSRHWPPHNPGEKFWVEMPKAGLTCNGMERFLLWLLSTWVWVLNVYLSGWKPKVQTPWRCRCWWTYREFPDSAGIPATVQPSSDLLSCATVRDRSHPSLCLQRYHLLASDNAVSRPEVLPPNIQTKPKLIALPSEVSSCKSWSQFPASSYTPLTSAGWGLFCASSTPIVAVAWQCSPTATQGVLWWTFTHSLMSFKLFWRTPLVALLSY